MNTKTFYRVMLRSGGQTGQTGPCVDNREAAEQIQARVPYGETWIDEFLVWIY